MGIEVGGLLGLIVLVADVWAIINVVQSGAGTGAKVAWGRRGPLPPVPFRGKERLGLRVPRDRKVGHSEGTGVSRPDPGDAHPASGQPKGDPVAQGEGPVGFF